MFGPEYFTVAGYLTDGAFLCRGCGDKAGLPVSDQIMQSEFNGGDWNDGCYCDDCGDEICAPYEWMCPYCDTEHTGEEAADLEGEYYRGRTEFKCSDDCPGDEE